MKWQFSNENLVNNNEFTYKCLKKAENHLFRLSQLANFHNEYELLKNGEILSPNSRIYQLNPFLDENGVIRSKSRISASNASYNSKYPIILDSNCKLTHLIIDFFHRNMMHAGTHLLLTAIRKKFWIIRCRMTVKSVVNSCKSCRRYKLKSLEQPFSPLVTDRVSNQNLRPFESMGIDYY